MRRSIILVFLLMGTQLFSQIAEGQKFCKETTDGAFFPLSINKKKILWGATSYVELNNGTKIINGKKYIEIAQDWGNNKINELYLREEGGVIYQYEECCEQETIRYDASFAEGHSWTTADGKSEYTIVSYAGTLKTPFCTYENLLVIHAKLSYGTFYFYYFRGHGYVGATIENEIISCVTPKWKD